MTAIEDYDEVYGNFNSAYSGRLAAQTLHDDDDRNNRFQPSSLSDATGRMSMRDRAASQPPYNSEQPYLSSPSTQPFVPSSLGGSGNPWSSNRLVSPTVSRGQPMPIRSSSLTTSNQNQFGSVMRERSFPSTLEDDESEDYDGTYGDYDTYDEQLVPPSLSRGRSYAQEFSRSRSQSLATTRPGPIGSPYTGGSAMQSWNDSYLSNMASSLHTATASRYGSLGAANNFSSSPTIGNGYSRHLGPTADGSNMSPFRRDVGQIVLDDGPFRELWAGMNVPRDEHNGGGGSGTTSRRHSVSVQPRRGVVQGFNAPVNEPEEAPRKPYTSTYSRGGLTLSDDDLASDLANDLGTLDIKAPHLPPSQPASLPIYAPLSRSPPSKDLFQPMINVAVSSYSASRQQITTPSDQGNESPSTNRASGYFNDDYYAPAPIQKPADLPARYVPGQGIQTSLNINPNYNRARAPSYSSQTTPISPTTGTRLINPQQQPFYPQQIQRRPSDAASQPSQQTQGFSELGKGVPLSAVPPSCPLYIVEFKAGRTDLFYSTDLGQDIKVGDLVIVEADRGKDLGKVVNDTITLGEVEAFQKHRAEQAAAAGYGGGGNEPTSPGGTNASSKKEINPKMIYGKASAQDTQLLAAKLGDEQKALQLCQTKVRAKNLPMKVIDAEYQWDRRKLTFYFMAEKRIDFRELVRELFRLYKTRIWMASLPEKIEPQQA